MNNNNLLLRHGYISIPNSDSEGIRNGNALATVAMNLSYYGFSLAAPALKNLSTLNESELETWWASIEPELRNITGDDRNIGDFVLYKNFPQEVLDKSEAEYWFAQILMYWGLPNELFTQEVKPRPNLSEQPVCKVLHLANQTTLLKILNSYVQSPSRWKKEELEDVLYLAQSYSVDFTKFSFKENMVTMATTMVKKGYDLQIATATDLLRLAAGMSDGDVSLREKVRFARFSRKTRRFFMKNLSICKNLDEDLARRPELWKRFIHNLHPGDYKNKFPRVVEAYNKLYNDDLTTFNSSVEKLLAEKDAKVLQLLSSRPGEFRRRLVHCLDLFGSKAVSAFTTEKVLSSLTTYQLVSMRRFLETNSTRETRAFPPRGNWGKLQIREARKVDAELAQKINKEITKVLKKRVPKVKELDVMAENIKLSSNDGEVSPYARGTRFPIPENIKFIRTASYWKKRSFGNVWFDNGWNFFDSNWKSVGTCCWNLTHRMGWGAAFSGDPTNSKEMEGRAAQLIDLYLDELEQRGVRYAVWNILCYSNIPFDQAEEVYAALQWGEKPTEGKLFEPSRCQLSFPLAGSSKTKYICYIDLRTREMVYMDANLAGNVSSAGANCALLEKQMPAYVDYLNSLPSVHDLFRDSVSVRGKGHVLYSDKDVELKDVPAYVFRPENEANKFEAMDLNKILSK